MSLPDLNDDVLLFISTFLDIKSKIHFANVNTSLFRLLNNVNPFVKLIFKTSVPKLITPLILTDPFYYASSLSTTVEIEKWAKNAILSGDNHFYQNIKTAIQRKVFLGYSSKSVETHVLTQEQLRIIQHPPEEKSHIVVQAFAGTGKTSIMLEYARKNPNIRILYIAYNNTLAKESAEKFKELTHVNVKTMHAFVLNEQSLSEVGEFGVEEMLTVFPLLNPTSAIQLLKSFSIYCNSDTFQSNPEIDKIWGAMFTDKTLPVSHDAYLKAYQLQQVVNLNYDVIIVDEVQDFTDCMLNILCNFENTTKIFIGDAHQKIYGFKNVNDPYKYIREYDPKQLSYHHTLTKSFRFGYDLSKFVNRFLKYKMKSRGFTRYINENTQLEVFKGEYKKLSPNTVIITRYNVTLFETMFTLASQNINFHLNGETYDLTKEIECMQDLLCFETSKTPFLQRFSNIDDFIEYVYTIKHSKWMLRVSLVLKYGHQVIPLMKNTLHHMTKQNGIGIINAHKSKGLEFDEVVLTNDFSFNDDDSCNVLYVALTRAKKKIHIPPKLMNYMFHKQPKLKFYNPKDKMNGRCSSCHRFTKDNYYVECDPEVVVSFDCTLYISNRFCTFCH